MDKTNKNSTNISTIKLVYEDSGNSVKLVRDDIAALNTRLSLLLGFNAAFIRLSMDLPGQASYFDSTTTDVLFCYSCQWLKAFTLILAIASIAMNLYGIWPQPVASILLPKYQISMVEKHLQNFDSEDKLEDAFRRGVIENRHTVIEDFLEVGKKKASRLKLALTCLGLAASLGAIDLLIHLFVC
jgi:hypothetical protein